MFVGLLAIGFVFCLCVEQYALSIRKNTRQPPSSKFYIILTIINAANALFWAAMPSMGWGRYSLDPTGTHCAIEWMNPDEGCKSYMAVICILGFAVPMAISMAILYQSFPASLTATSASSGSPRDDGFTESQLRWLSVTFLILVVVGWGPFALLIMWAIVANPFTVSMLVAASPPLACKIMTMSYPLAYNVANPKFRAGYLSMLGVSATKTSRKSE